MKGKQHVTLAKSGPGTGDGVVQSGLDDIFYVSRPSRSRQRKETGKGLSLDVLHE